MQLPLKRSEEGYILVDCASEHTLVVPGARVGSTKYGYHSKCRYCLGFKGKVNIEHSN